jgi:oligopeptide/dipeptide ABC transporter ATP-binding protein
MAPLLELENVHVAFPVRAGVLRRTVAEVQAVSGVSITVEEGQTLGIVGESGCGKTTLGRSIAGLERIKSGIVRFRGSLLDGAALQRHRREIQMVFQDPFSSLNPRMTVRQLVQEAWKIHSGLVSGSQWDSEAGRLIEMVGLHPDQLDNYPHQFSGGQRQRIGVARCLAARPSLIVCDEPASALDVSIQAQIVNLLQDLQDELGLSYIFIAHDLSVVRHISDTVSVMYLGKIVEAAPASEIYQSPTHPYTQALLSSVLSPDPWEEQSRDRIELRGDVPSPIRPPSGCRFRTRCWKAQPVCAEEEPPLIDRGLGHPSACHFAEILEETPNRCAPESAADPHRASPR